MSGLKVWLSSLQFLTSAPPAVNPSAPRAWPITHSPQGAVALSQLKGESSRWQSWIWKTVCLSPELCLTALNLILLLPCLPLEVRLVCLGLMCLFCLKAVVFTE